MIEEDFAAALLDPDLPAPSAISAAHRSRFAIYRNNVALSLIEALAVRFPAVRCVVGEDFFAQTARLFVTKHPPTSRMLALYGEALPIFSIACPLAPNCPISAISRGSKPRARTPITRPMLRRSARMCWRALRPKRSAACVSRCILPWPLSIRAIRSSPSGR